MARHEESSVDMSSECGDIPSDESLSVSFEGAAPMLSSGLGSTSSIESLFSGLGTETELRTKYPEFYKQILTHRLCSMSPRSGNVVEAGGLELNMDTSEGRLLKDALELCKALRKAERVYREKEKEFDLLQTQNRQMRETYVKIYAKAEQEEEYISNCLLKRIQKLKNDKETLAQKYEQEEEFLTNDLMRRIQQLPFELQTERDSLEGKMKTEQGALIDNLLQTIRRMETEMANSRKNMDRMRKEKIDQENALENEQELLFNTLGKQMDQLNNEKRKLQQALTTAYERGYMDAEDIVALTNQPPCTSDAGFLERPSSALMNSGDSPSLKVSRLHNEIGRLRAQLRNKDVALTEMQAKLEQKEMQIREMTGHDSAREKFINAVLDASQTYLAAEKVSLDRNEMGPPSVPSSLLHDPADMDDFNSRSSYMD